MRSFSLLLLVSLLYGDLGIGRQGHDQDVGDQPGEMGDALPFVTL